MIDEIKSMIESKRFKEVKNMIHNLNAVQIADVFEELMPSESVIVFRMLAKDLAADVFSYLSSEQQLHIINTITDHEIKNIIDELFFDDMIDIIEEMPSNVVKKILENTKVEERGLINQFLNYPEFSAGSLMTIEYVDLKRDMTVRQAIDRIKETGIEKETIYTCYVLGTNRKLEGTLSLKRLIITSDEVTIGEIMSTNFIAVHTHDDQEEIANLFKKYDLIALPVIDAESRLAGIITIDDIVDVIDQENTEDFQKMAGIQPTEEPYLENSVLNMAKHRFIWLMVLMVSATFTGRIIQKYEMVLQSVVVLAAFIPMLMDTGGNAGAQSSTMVIRGLALGDLRTKDLFKIVRKELAVSVVVATALSIINLLRIVFLEKIDYRIAITVTITLFITIVLAKVVGAVLPVVARVVNVDPAVMASPLITTIVDAVALMVYFALAAVFLGV
jgi:magnesium transporter